MCVAVLNRQGKNMSPHLAEETQDEVFGHQRFPSRGGQDEGVAGARLFCVGIELLGLAGGLGAGPGDDEDVLESVGVESIPRQTDDALPLLARKVLRFAIRSLDEDPVDGSLQMGAFGAAVRARLRSRRRNSSGCTWAS
jgi:hypothetical protein